MPTVTGFSERLLSQDERRKLVVRFRPLASVCAVGMRWAVVAHDSQPHKAYFPRTSGYGRQAESRGTA
jgi:hypothetical protein